MSYLRFDPNKTIREYESELEKELPFNKMDLDNEYSRQPELYMKWAGWWGKALLLRRRTEAGLDKAKAEADLDIRKNPKNYGLVPDDKGKIMESAIKSSIIKHTKVVEAEEYFYKAYELAKLLEYAVKAFEQRKELLRGEGELWVNKYYSGVQVTVEDRAERQENKETIHEGLSDRMRSRRTNLD